MKLVQRFGLALVGLVLLGCMWLGTQMFTAAPPAIAQGHISAPAAPAATADADSSRIIYPPGHYPQLQSRDGATHVVHSVLNVTHALAFGDYVWDASGVPAGPVWVRIDLSRQLLSVFRGGDEIGTAVIIYGANDHPTPVGTFHILEKSQFYYSKSYDAPMPYALRLTADGVALHASSVRERKATHGCVGLPLEFARLLYAAANRGDQVEILPETAAT